MFENYIYLSIQQAKRGTMLFFLATEFIVDVTFVEVTPFIKNTKEVQT